MIHQKIDNEGKGEEIRNPGALLNISDKCTSIFPVFFDGLRIIIHRGLSQHFRVTHALYFSSVTPGNYRFGATYVGNKMIGLHEGVPVVMGDIDSRGNMNASLYHLFGSRLKVRLDAQLENRSFKTSQLTTHYFGDSFTASALLVNPDPLNATGCLLLQYLQNVTPRLALGTELACIRGYRSPLDTQVALVGRYTTLHAVWSAVLSRHSLQLCCYKQASHQVQFGVELDTNFRTNESVTALGYQITLPEHGIVFKGCVDTNTNVGSVFEKNISGTPFAFSVSVNLNHKSNNFRLGLGFILE